MSPATCCLESSQPQVFVCHVRTKDHWIKLRIHGGAIVPLRMELSKRNQRALEVISDVCRFEDPQITASRNSHRFSTSWIHQLIAAGEVGQPVTKGSGKSVTRTSIVQKHQGFVVTIRDAIFDFLACPVRHHNEQ
eukprot:jgi/Bigna1/142833/aug1.73_g17541